MSDHENRPARAPEAGQRIPGPMGRCKGELHIVRAETPSSHCPPLRSDRPGHPGRQPADSATRMSFSSANLSAYRPRSLGLDPNPNLVRCELVVLLRKVPVQKRARKSQQWGSRPAPCTVIVRARFNRPVSRAFFFLEPTGTETCELVSLIGVDCPSAVTGVAEIIWDVPRGTLGRVFVVACLNSVCAKSDDVLVVRD